MSRVWSFREKSQYPRQLLYNFFRDYQKHYAVLSNVHLPPHNINSSQEALSSGPAAQSVEQA